MPKNSSLSGQLFSLGFLTLFLELVLIRYLSGTIWNLGYFPNLVLLAVFFGMGIGFCLHHHIEEKRSENLFAGAAYGLLALLLFAGFVKPGLPGFDFQSGEFGGELFFTTRRSWHPLISLPLFLVWFFGCLVIFALISQRTAKLFARFEPLKAYTLDISGSLCGILTFMVISYFQIPAWVWFLGLIPLFFASGVSVYPKRRYVEMALVACALIAFAHHLKIFSERPSTIREYDVSWSPYQKVQYTAWGEKDHLIRVNGIPHQVMRSGEDILKDFYQIPYDKRHKKTGVLKYRNVLVLGAGSGNDVAAALLNGAEHVDAVEIDPVIAEMGLKHHPAKPYQDPRVTLVIDDGRAFMNRAKKRYDLIVFALTDSLVKIASVGQLRLENYLFTEEAVTRASQLLASGGDLLFYNFYRRPWLTEKIERLIHRSSGFYPVRLSQNENFVVIAAGVYNQRPAPTLVSPEATVTPVDDWPFLYLKSRSVPSHYLFGMGFLIALSFGFMAFLRSRFANRDTSPAERSTAANVGFALMGVAFLLLEAKSVTQFALLFGTTWVNSSLVFFGVLSLVLAANWAASRLKATASYAILVGLLVTSLLPLLFPLSGLLSVENTFVRFVLASLLTFSPIFFANLLFSLHFREQKYHEHVFGWNLLGACIGGMVEYLSMATGYRSLAVVVAVCYGAAFICLWMGRATQPSPAPSLTPVEA